MIIKNPSRKGWGKLKSSSVWKAAVQAAVPAFTFSWRNAMHPVRRAVYLSSKFRGGGRAKVNATGLELIFGDPDFEKFARWLRSRIPESVLESQKAALLSRDDESSFTCMLENFLDDETKAGIVEFALSDKALSIVLPYFGFVPRLDSTHILFNIPKPGFKPEGSQRWHRDGDLYRALNLFICLSDVDDESGSYSAIGLDQIPYHAAIPFEKMDTELSIWHNARHADDYIFKFVSPKNVHKLQGPVGSTAVVDPAACYHKGGHCRSKPRIMIQLQYFVDRTQSCPSVIEKLKIDKHPKIKKMLEDKLKALLLAGNTDQWYHKLKQGHPSFFIGRRVMTYYLDSTSAKSRD